jgi:hypothetical protein
MSAEFARRWANANTGKLYMTLSDPCKSLMHTCKKVARSKVVLYHLRPGVRSTANECKYQESTVEDLLTEGSFPPNFTLGKDESGNLHFLENDVVWDVVVDAVSEHGLYGLITNVDNLFCLAAAAVACALHEMRRGYFHQVEFTAEAYQGFYDRLANHLKALLSHDKVFFARWREYTDLTMKRLKQIDDDAKARAAAEAAAAGTSNS